MSEREHWKNLHWYEMTDEDKRAMVREYGAQYPEEAKYVRNVFKVANILYDQGVRRGVRVAEQIIAELGLDDRPR